MIPRVEFRAEAHLSGDTLEGVAHVFGARALIGGRHYETFSVGAFDEALKSSDVRAFHEHDRRMLLGRQKTGTLRVTADSVGLPFEIDLPNTTYGRDVRALVERGDLDSMSFGFIPGVSQWAKAPDGFPERRHTQARELVDISTVALPAFTGTNLQLRSDGFAVESTRSQLVRARARVRTGV